MATFSKSTVAGVSVVRMVLLGLLLALAMVKQATADCGNVNSLASCLPSASTGSEPPQSCCEAMEAFTHGGSPDGNACLCQAVSNPAAKSAGAKPQFAIEIPQKCKLSYKAGYKCNGVLVPGGHA